MEATVTSLFWISLVAVASPLLAGFVPRRLVSEVVPARVRHPDRSLRPGAGGHGRADRPAAGARAGVPLPARGFEVELRELTGRAGGTAALTLLGCLLLAWGSSPCSGSPRCWTPRSRSYRPDRRPRHPCSHPQGPQAAEVAHRRPRPPTRRVRAGLVVAIAVLLGTRGPFGSLVVLAAFLLLTLGLAVLSRRLRPDLGPAPTDRRRSGDDGADPARLVVLL